jgi:UDP-N-acetylmuramoyl-tripeptide--D-alanyl-D-alanine ligase
MSGLTTAWVARWMRDHGYDVVEGPDVPVTGGAADSRRVTAGDLFAAYPGERTDGNLYVGDAFERGAVAAVCSRRPVGEWPGRTIAVVPDVREAMGLLARDWRRACGPRVVGITGTVGKTTTKEITGRLIGTRFRTHRSPGNLNSREGMPLAVMSLSPGHEVSVLELAMDRKGEIVELCEIAEPEVGIVLNIGLTHAEKLGSIEAIAEEKLSLARWLGPGATAILNADDPRVAAGAAGLRARVLTFGASDSAMLRRGPIADRGHAGTRFDVTWDGQVRTVESPLPGAHLVSGLLAAMAAGLALGMTMDEVVDAAAHTAGSGRMRALRGHNGATILDDSYNSSPASLAGALEHLAGLPGRHLALLGKMAELGEASEQEHRRLGAIAAGTTDILFTFGPDCEALAAGARDAGHHDVRWFSTRDEAAAAARETLREGDTILVKGSRSEELERVLPTLGVEA